MAGKDHLVQSSSQGRVIPDQTIPIKCTSNLLLKMYMSIAQCHAVWRPSELASKELAWVLNPGLSFQYGISHKPNSSAEYQDKSAVMGIALYCVASKLT